jgi:hypothetical protein
MEILIKKFIEWINLKEKLHNISAHVPLVKERDVGLLIGGDCLAEWDQ